MNIQLPKRTARRPAGRRAGSAGPGPVCRATASAGIETAGAARALVPRLPRLIAGGDRARCTVARLVAGPDSPVAQWPGWSLEATGPVSPARRWQCRARPACRWRRSARCTKVCCTAAAGARLRPGQGPILEGRARRPMRHGKLAAAVRRRAATTPARRARGLGARGHFAAG